MVIETDEVNMGELWVQSNAAAVQRFGIWGVFEKFFVDIVG